MRFIAQATILSLLALTAAASLAAASSVPPPETSKAFLRRMAPTLHRDEVISKTNAELKTILIPKFEMRDVTVQAVVDELNLQIRNHNSQPSAFQIPHLRIRHYSGLDATLAPSRNVSGLEKADPSPVLSIPPEDARITLSLSKITLAEAVRYVTNLSALMIDIEPGAIWLKPLIYPTIILTKRVYIISDSICSTKAQVEKLLADTCPDFQPVIPKGRPEYWKFDESTHLLSLRYAEPFIDQFEKSYARELLNHGFKIPATPSN
jgi:hypothetical protein